VKQKIMGEPVGWPSADSLDGPAIHGIQATIVHRFKTRIPNLLQRFGLAVFFRVVIIVYIAIRLNGRVIHVSPIVVAYKPVSRLVIMKINVAASIGLTYGNLLVRCGKIHVVPLMFMGAALQRSWKASGRQKVPATAA
jgi:hypothetical protein